MAHAGGESHPRPSNAMSARRFSELYEACVVRSLITVVREKTCAHARKAGSLASFCYPPGCQRMRAHVRARALTGVGNWAPSTVNHHRSLISLAYQLGIRNGKVTSNPARATKHRKEDNTRIRFLTHEEEARLRAVVVAKWPQHIAEVDLALHTGLRRSEMYGLDWTDVDVARRFLKVRRGKNGSGRHVRLNAIAIQALVALQAASDGSGAVVRNRAGGAMRGPRHWFEKAVAQAGLQDFRWHDLRHTFASRLAMAGVGIRAIQEAMGHKSIAMTVRYSHLSPDFLQDAVDRLVPQPEESQPIDRAGTRTDTSDAGSIEPGRGNVH